MVKALNQVYAESPSEERMRFVREFRIVITCYLTKRLGKAGA
jgi:hypothetical protein